MYIYMYLRLHLNILIERETERTKLFVQVRASESERERDGTICCVMECTAHRYGIPRSVYHSSESKNSRASSNRACAWSKPVRGHRGSMTELIERPLSTDSYIVIAGTLWYVMYNSPPVQDLTNLGVRELRGLRNP